MTLLFRVLSVLVVLMVFGTTMTMAQDVTPEPEPEPMGDVVNVGDVVAGEDALVSDVTNTLRQSVIDVVAVVAGAIGAIVVILAGTFAIVIGRLGSHLYQSTPSYLRDALVSFLDNATLQLQGATDKIKTPFEIDDVFADKLREVVEPLVVQHLNNAIRTAKERAEGDKAA